MHPCPVPPGDTWLSGHPWRWPGLALVAGPLTGALGMLASMLAGRGPLPILNLAGANLARRRHRNGLAAAGIMVGMVLAVSQMAMGHSALQAYSETVRRHLPADLVISPPLTTEMQADQGFGLTLQFNPDNPAEPPVSLPPGCARVS